MQQLTQLQKIQLKQQELALRLLLVAAVQQLPTQDPQKELQHMQLLLAHLLLVLLRTAELVMLLLPLLRVWHHYLGRMRQRGGQQLAWITPGLYRD